MMMTEPLLRSLLYFDQEIRKILKDPSSQLFSLSGDWEHQASYQLRAKGTNLRFDYKPWFIVYCKCVEEVAETFKLAVATNIPIRIRAGGHDHEGEYSGDGTVLIDVSEMNNLKLDENTGLAKIGPGNRFLELTSSLANAEVMIPHGTCGTVGIAGFLLGGGWGTWTRKYGMCCERLKGATVVLGDGSIANVDVPKDQDQVPDLLWALRGGGGMSFGIVTEFRVQTFKLPEELIRFKITWNPYPDLLIDLPKDFPDKPESANIPTLEVLKLWENVILSDKTPQLIGTDLKINACPRESGQVIDYQTVCNNCVMAGYWEGTEAELQDFVYKWFGPTDDYELYINPEHGGTENTNGKPYGAMLMSDWTRESTTPMLRAAAEQDRNIKLSDEYEALITHGKPLPPDYDTPAPNKVTSRFVTAEGLGEKGYKAFIESLWSPLVLPGNRAAGLSQFVTLHAITGDFYRDYVNKHQGELNRLSSFPYKDTQYIMQYQTWWNKELEQIQMLDMVKTETTVYNRVNRALDWIEMTRATCIPKTRGAFISFKDLSVPTKTYFSESYERLVCIKKEKVRDPRNHLRIRKSIT